MMAGFGRALLTPPLGTELAGYGYYLARRAEGVLDPLWCRALYLTQEDTSCLIVSCDVLGLSRGAVQALREGLSREGFDGTLLIVSIHTHTGPAVISHEGCGEVSPEYAASVPGRLLEACRAAMSDALRVTGLAGTLGAVEDGLVYNRSSDSGPVDPTVRGLFVYREGRPTAVLASFACHPVCSGRIPQVSADYPGQLMRLLAQQGMEGMFLGGLCGDIDPVPVAEDERMARRDLLAASIARALSGDREPLPLTLSCFTLPLTLRLQSVTPEAIRESADRAARLAGEGSGAARVARIWEKDMLERYPAFARAGFEEPFHVSCAVLGGRHLLALPFEGFTAIGMHIRRRLGREDAMVLGCAEELLGYLPSLDDIRRGAYAALESTYLYRRLPVLPGQAEAIAEAIASALEGGRA